jgi:myo-inositol-1-phosphate synthase
MKHVNNAKKTIKIAGIGIGNCFSSLYQGIHYYKTVKDDSRLVDGLMHNTIGGYAISDIEVVAAFDVDKRKVGKDVSQAIFEKPNCTKVFCPNIPLSGVTVKMGPVLDGVAPHMVNYPAEQTFVVSDEEPVDVAAELIKSGAQILLCYLPVGSQRAVEYYAEAALKAKCAFINCMPIFIVSDSVWENRFKEAGLPCIGDDVKSQVGSTIVHRALVDLFVKRGIHITETYQQNIGGNTDFLNMLVWLRNITKVISKGEAILCLLKERLSKDKFYAGPTGYNYALKDNKIADISIKGNQFGDVPMNLKLKMSVEDSPNSAGCIIDAIRILRIALDRGLSGAILPACSYFMKHPPRQVNDDKAREEMERFIFDSCRNIIVSPSRTKDFANSGEDYSEVWTSIYQEAKKQADDAGIHLEAIALENSYDDVNELVELIRKAVVRLYSFGPGYEKNLFLSFCVTERNIKEKIINILKGYPEINLYGINVPPDNEYVSALPNICGYVGMDEFILGQKLFHEMVSRVDISRIIVLRQKVSHYGYDLRIEGIKSLACERNIEVVVCNHTDHETMRKIILSGNSGIITFGNRGTEQVFALDVNDVIIPVVTVDSSKKIKKIAVNSNKQILASYLQEGLYGRFICGENRTISPMKSTA